MTRFLTLFDTVVTDPLEDIPTVNELEKWLKNVGEQAFYFLIRLAAAGLLLFIGSKLIKFLMNRFKRSKLYQKMDPGLASFMASGSRIVLYIILILMCFGVLGIETASFLALFTSGGVAIWPCVSGRRDEPCGRRDEFCFFTRSAWAITLKRRKLPAR